MKDIKTTMYIIVDKRGTGDISTLNYKKSDCISKFLSGSTISWNQAKKIGWKCEKVDATISPCANYWR